MCGGAIAAVSPPSVLAGRSPRVRGGHRILQRQRAARGSIPACAGEPTVLLSWYLLHGVDPRVCGGAQTSHMPRFLRWGRSPRVRGSPMMCIGARLIVRSIPACAGEPQRCHEPSKRQGVDPRVCGGAFLAPSLAQRALGRSPRVRGSLAIAESLGWNCGSIPACAGEPHAHLALVPYHQVDPRVCGGAYPRMIHAPRHKGRSPRVRGSQAIDACRKAGLRSIPACAGEPYGSRSKEARLGVDPRVCGGAGVLAKRVNS